MEDSDLSFYLLSADFSWENEKIAAWLSLAIRLTVYRLYDPCSLTTKPLSLMSPIGCKPRHRLIGRQFAHSRAGGQPRPSLNGTAHVN